jgi:hypothetical protein
MDEIMNKVGSYWLGQKANKEMSSAGDDLEVRPCMGQNPISSSALFSFCSFSRGTFPSIFDWAWDCSVILRFSVVRFTFYMFRI